MITALTRTFPNEQTPPHSAISVVGFIRQAKISSPSCDMMINFSIWFGSKSSIRVRSICTMRGRASGGSVGEGPRAVNRASRLACGTAQVDLMKLRMFQHAFHGFVHERVAGENINHTVMLSFTFTQCRSPCCRA